MAEYEVRVAANALQTRDFFPNELYAVPMEENSESVSLAKHSHILDEYATPQSPIYVKPSVLMHLGSVEPSLISKLPAAGPTKVPESADAHHSMAVAEPPTVPSSATNGISAEPSLALMPIDLFNTENSFVSRGVRRGQTKLPAPAPHTHWKLMRVISGHVGWVRSLTVDISNAWFASGAGDRTIKIWDLASGELKVTLTGHISPVRGLAVSDRHPYLFSGGEDKQVKCWDLEQNKVVRHYHGHLQGVYALAIHPTLDLLVTAGRDAVARVWDIRTRQPVYTLAGHSSTIHSLAVQASHPQIITASADSTVRLWDLAAGKTFATLTHHKASVRALALHPREFTFACGGIQDSLKKFLLPNGVFLHDFKSVSNKQVQRVAQNRIINCMAVHPDDQFMVSGSDDGHLELYDWRSGQSFQCLESPPQLGSLDSEAGIFAMTFDRSGLRLITGEADKTIKVWRECLPEELPVDDM